MTRIVIAAVLLVIAGVVAVVLERRRAASATVTVARDEYSVARQIDRRDFPRPEAPWLVVLFSADRCDNCANVRPKLAALESAEVAVFDAEEARSGSLHRKYGVEAVPMTLLADTEGVVVDAYFGRVTATDLWAAVAEARQPGSRPPGGCADHGTDEHGTDEQGDPGTGAMGR